MAASRVWHLYMVRCADGALYSGVTTDLDRRLREHNAGRGSACTRARRPVRLVYRKRCVGRGSALRQEAGLKRLSRRKKEGLLRTSWAG